MTQPKFIQIAAAGKPIPSGYGITCLFALDEHGFVWEYDWDLNRWHPLSSEQDPA